VSSPNKNTAQLSGEWRAIANAAASATDSGLDHLEHPAGRVYIFKRRQTDVITRCLEDASPLSHDLRLRSAMFSHHMPWGYGALFEGYGQSSSQVDLSVLPLPALDSTGPAQQPLRPPPPANAPSQSTVVLYPDLNECQWNGRQRSFSKCLQQSIFVQYHCLCFYSVFNCVKSHGY